MYETYPKSTEVIKPCTGIAPGLCPSGQILIKSAAEVLVARD